MTPEPRTAPGRARLFHLSIRPILGRMASSLSHLKSRRPEDERLYRGKDPEHRPDRAWLLRQDDAGRRPSSSTPGRPTACQGGQGQHGHRLRARRDRAQDLDQLATPCFCEWNDHKINLVDTPGYTNFLWDTRAALRAVDGAAVLVDAVAGVEVGTEKVWEMIEQRGLPRLFVINKMDRENANFARALESVQQFFGRQAIPVQMPIGRGEELPRRRRPRRPEGLSLREGRERQDESEPGCPTDLADEVERRYKELLEMIAESDEKLMEKYLDKGELAPEEFRPASARASSSTRSSPSSPPRAWPTSASSPCSTASSTYCPRRSRPSRPRPRSRARTRSSACSADGPFAALVFKTISDPYTGRISLMRVFSGKVNPDAGV